MFGAPRRVYSRGLIAEIAENALVEVVAIERICAIDLVRFRSEWDPLVLNSQQFRRVMDDAVAVVVVADRRMRSNASTWAASGFADFVETAIPSVIGVAQARQYSTPRGRLNPPGPPL